MMLSTDRHKTEAKNTGGNTAVLYVHGIQGSPCQFRFLIEQLPEKVAYFNLCLPGHGSDCRAFAKSGADDWRSAVARAALRLKERYEHVFFVGHSMGCLLGMLSAIEDGFAFDGMLLIACPLKLHFTFHYLTHNHLTLIVKNSRNPYLLAAYEANSIGADHIWQYAACMPPYIELLRLIKRTRKALKPLNCPVTGVFLDRDEIVSPRSAHMLRNSCGAQVVSYRVCGHNYFTDDAKKDMIVLQAGMLSRTPID